jgi:formylglycine-generating enzyme required for sulfatase activity
VPHGRTLFVVSKIWVTVRDMSGNVNESTATPWRVEYGELDGATIEMWGQRSDGVPTSDADVINDESMEEEDYSIRGGGRSDDRRIARCAFRLYNSPADRIDFLGVRLVAALTQDG